MLKFGNCRHKISLIFVAKLRYLFLTVNLLPNNFIKTDNGLINVSKIIYIDTTLVEELKIEIKSSDEYGNIIKDVATNLNAIEILTKKIHEVNFFVFSDDIDFAKSEFKNIKNIVFVENKKEPWKDLALMSFCKHHIIANSSFSWWGAWLNNNHDSINIAPKLWLNPEYSNFDIDNYIPNHWIKL